MFSEVDVFAEPLTSNNLPYLNFVNEASTPQENVFAVKTFLIFTVLTLVPSILITNNSICSNYNSFIYNATVIGLTAITTKSSLSIISFIFDYFIYVASN